MNTIRKLRTIQPIDGVVLLPITPAEAEYQWFNEVSYNDRKDFELLVEPHGSDSCLGQVRSVSQWWPKLVRLVNIKFVSRWVIISGVSKI